jgi:hypothetical protein
MRWLHWQRYLHATPSDLDIRPTDVLGLVAMMEFADHFLIDDLIQDVMEKLYAGMETFGPRASTYQWGFRQVLRFVYPEDGQSSKFQDMLKELVLAKFFSLESKAQHSWEICFPKAMVKEVQRLRGNKTWQENLKSKKIREEKKLRDDMKRRKNKKLRQFQKKWAEEDARHRE